MRIDSKDTICDVPIMKVRDALRGPVGYHSTFEYFVEDFGISKKRAQDLITELKRRGYIKKYEGKHDKQSWWGLTVEGRSFTMASAAPPISRKKAEKKVAELLERIKEISSSKEYAFKVSIAIIFGSYLDENKDTVNDIDIAYELIRKSNYDEISKKIRSEKYFYSWQDELFWPERKVRGYLKKRSRVYSLHKTDEIIGFIKDKNRDIRFKILYIIPELSIITDDFIRLHPDVAYSLIMKSF